MNLLDMLSFDGSTLRKVATTHGGEYAGPCPFCGGNDRFRVWPQQDDGRYWCRGCGKAGDAIQYLRDHRGLSFAEACKVMGRDLGPQPNGTQPAPSARAPRESTLPPDIWQTKAGAFLEMTQATLWTEEGKEARTLLHGKGLTDDTIRAAGLGWNSQDCCRARESWGLPIEIKENGMPKRLWIPAGLVIPCYADDQLIRLRIRRQEGDSRYYLIPGSDTGAMILNPDRAAVVILESELDGLLVSQEAGDLVTVIALGSAQIRPDQITHGVLTAAVVVLVCLDSDEAGAKAAWSFWSETYGRKVRRWPPIMGKDPSEAYRNGLNVRDWIIAGLFGTEAKFERWCIQTVDGGLTDAEALRETMKG